MMAYDINVDVKYKQIEVEMLANYHDKDINTSQLAEANPDRAFDEDYNEETIRYVCEELYRYELLTAFNKADTILDDKLDAGLSYLWQHIGDYKDFTNIVTKFSEKMCLSFAPLDDSSQGYLNSRCEENRLAFSLMFNFDLFHIVHRCLREYIQNGKIDNNLLVELDKEVDKMVF